MSRYRQSPNVGEATRFASSPMAQVEFSKMVATPTWMLPFNAGDIVPVYYNEVLPHETLSIDMDFVIRQTTLLRPTMGQMQVDFYAFFVPNRIINDSWKNVQGENTSGFWTAPVVTLAPLWKAGNDVATSVQIPVGSIADYYGFPTQDKIPTALLSQCNDLKIKGYLSVYNNYFRDQNYQPPVPFSTLNVYQGFLVPNGVRYSALGNLSTEASISKGDMVSNGTEFAGAFTKAIYGEGFTADQVPEQSNYFIVPGRMSTFNALGKPLKANKLHDYFTSVLPAPQKGQEVYFGIGNLADVKFDTANGVTVFPSGNKLRLSTDSNIINGSTPLYIINSSGDPAKNGVLGTDNREAKSESTVFSNHSLVNGTNIVATADLSEATGVSINDLRTAIATQQVYETLSRGGSRYSSMLRNFFDLETESPFMDIPLKLGHIRRNLDLYQVAQTSSSTEDSAQGTLSAYGYTQNGGHLFTRTFIEHGYVHVFAVVRQKNVYSTYFAPDNFRRGTLDFYLPQFANIGEQPVRLAQLNPFADDSMEKAIGYQEAWAEYRYEPDRIHGQMRSGIAESLDVWHYGDNYDSSFDHVNGEWLKSNAEEVLNRTLAVTSDVAPQFKGQFHFRIEKQLPMPTYSVPGIDTI